MTVEQASRTTCSTSSVEGLSRQIIAEALLADPQLVVPLKHVRIKPKYEHVYMWLQPYPAESLYRVVNRRKTAVLKVASCLRVLPQQLLLYTWYKAGRCRIKLAAPPGKSPHEMGVAVDVERPNDWRWAFDAEGWRWLGQSDPPHFDRISGRADVDNRMVEAFQRLANRHAAAGLKEDGSFGARTEAALRRAPAAGWKGDEMADSRTALLLVNGTPTPQVKCKIEGGNTWIDLSDWCDFADYARPTYNLQANTVAMSTAKQPDEDVEEEAAP